MFIKARPPRYINKLLIQKHLSVNSLCLGQIPFQGRSTVVKRRTYLKLHWRNGRARLESTISGQDRKLSMLLLPRDSTTTGYHGGWEGRWILQWEHLVNKASLIPLVNVCWKSDKTDSVANSKLLMASGHPGNENGGSEFWNEVSRPNHHTSLQEQIPTRRFQRQKNSSDRRDGCEDSKIDKDRDVWARLSSRHLQFWGATVAWSSVRDAHNNPLICNDLQKESIKPTSLRQTYSPINLTFVNVVFTRASLYSNNKM